MRQNAAEDIYRGGIDIVDEIDPGLYANLVDLEHIDWSDPLKDHTVSYEDDAKRFASMIHYVYLSQLPILGTVLGTVNDHRAIRLAGFLVPSRLMALDVWGRYMGTVGADGAIDQTVKTYTDELEAPDDPRIVLAGLLVWDEAFTMMPQVSDPDFLLHRLLGWGERQALHNLERGSAFFSYLHDQNDGYDRDIFDSKIATFRSQVTEIFEAHSGVLAGLDIDAHPLLEGGDPWTDCFGLFWD